MNDLNDIAVKYNWTVEELSEVQDLITAARKEELERLVQKHNEHPTSRTTPCSVVNNILATRIKELQSNNKENV